jgi:hypothetical protein
LEVLVAGGGGGDVLMGSVELFEFELDVEFELETFVFLGVDE